jgi:hypothetical protein
MGKELFAGTFVHSLSLQELEVSEQNVIGVQDGKIVFIEKNVGDLESLKRVKGFEDAKVAIHLEERLIVGNAIEGESILYSGVY